MCWMLLTAIIIIATPVSAQAFQLPTPLTTQDFAAFSEEKARIGRFLFYDPVLSGNQNISCGTCHIPTFGTSDGLSLGIGEGGLGLGPERTVGNGKQRIRKRVPRNSPGLWNLGALEIKNLFHDGRLSYSDLFGNGYNSPAEEWLPAGLEHILAAQALFPMVAQFEMAGNPGENQVAGAIHDRIDAAWPIIARRVRSIPGYVEMFVAAFDNIDRAEQIDISDIANAIGAFVGLEWRSYDSLFDAYLAGDKNAISQAAEQGLKLFYGKAGCAGCHSGKLLTDQAFHALAVPQFGPGRTRRFDPYARDVGRMAETDHLEDAYRFRTPSLRNVAMTAPYGHNGAYATLRGIVSHHLDPRVAFQQWNRSQANLPAAVYLEDVDFVVFEDKRERQRLLAKVDIERVSLNEQEIDQLVSFLHALTGRASLQGRLGKPATVPSGLEVR